MMTFPYRMQAYVSKELGKDIIYLSLMLLTERTIVGYDIPDTHEKLVSTHKRVDAPSTQQAGRIYLTEQRWRSAWLQRRTSRPCEFLPRRDSQFDL